MFKASMLGLFSLLIVSSAFAGESIESESKAEQRHCRVNGCFDQNVSTGMRITEISEETIYGKTDLYINVTITAIVDGIQDTETDFVITAWVGGPKLEQDRLLNAREFVRRLRESKTSGQLVNLVTWGHANQMTAEFPLLGFFTNSGKFFFMDRVSVPTLKAL